MGVLAPRPPIPQVMSIAENRHPAVARRGSDRFMSRQDLKKRQIPAHFSPSENPDNFNKSLDELSDKFRKIEE